MKPHRGTLILVFGILGIVACLPLGIAAWIMGGRDLKEMQAGTMDPSGRGSTSAGRVCGMIGTLLAGIIVVLMLVGGIAAFLLWIRTDAPVADRSTAAMPAEPSAVDQPATIVSETTRERPWTNNMPPAGMVLIPAGSFAMGDTFAEGDGGELPLHTVSVSAFYMDKYEVTKALWDEVYTWAMNNGYSFENVAVGKEANHPVNFMTWYDMVKWCNARSEKEGRRPAYYTDSAQTNVYRIGAIDVENGWVKWDTGYRLPTEAEWEKAARGGLSGKRFPWGDNITHSLANYKSTADDVYDTSSTRGYHHLSYYGGPSATSPVGSFAANGYGLYDMVGNVWERCWDRSGTYGSSPATDPRGPTSGSDRVLRGGSWYDSARRSRTAFRNSGSNAASRSYLTGFRPVLPLGQ